MGGGFERPDDNGQEWKKERSLPTVVREKGDTQGSIGHTEKRKLGVVGGRLRGAVVSSGKSEKGGGEKEKLEIPPTNLRGENRIPGHFPTGRRKGGNDTGNNDFHKRLSKVQHRRKEGGGSKIFKTPPSKGKRCGKARYK